LPFLNVVLPFRESKCHKCPWWWDHFYFHSWWL
jgi:hypothetical protein